ncbi:MAG: DUF2344 domain-containing protein [Planctomycetes bacterium]|nr:DUF2344 domain-containing protein [Planctomycetota bacterium]
MAPDLSSVPITSNSSPAKEPLHPQPFRQGEPDRQKFRVRFRKAGDLRLVSHHDLMHVFERMFRRADLAIPVSQGFNPRPRMWFALSLALGVAGLNEVLEFEVSEPLETDTVRAKLEGQCPPGIDILNVIPIEPRKSGRVRRAWYRLPLAGASGNLTERCTAFLQQAECWIERQRPNPRRVNVRPFVDVLRNDGDQLTMALWITPTGAARPEEVLAALGLQDLLDAGGVIERTDLELYDEMPPDAAPAPVIQGALKEIGTNDKLANVEPPRPTPIFDSPMSFET